MTFLSSGGARRYLLTLSARPARVSVWLSRLVGGTVLQPRKHSERRTQRGLRWRGCRRRYGQQSFDRCGGLPRAALGARGKGSEMLLCVWRRATRPPTRGRCRRRGDGVKAGETSPRRRRPPRVQASRAGSTAAYRHRTGRLVARPCVSSNHFRVRRHRTSTTSEVQPYTAPLRGRRRVHRLTLTSVAKSVSSRVGCVSSMIIFKIRRHSDGGLNDLEARQTSSGGASNAHNHRTQQLIELSAVCSWRWLSRDEPIGFTHSESRMHSTNDGRTSVANQLPCTTPTKVVAQCCLEKSSTKQPNLATAAGWWN